MKRSDAAILTVSVALLTGFVGFGIGRFSAPKAAATASSGSSSGGQSATGFGGTGTRRAGGRPIFGTVASLSGTTLVITDTAGASHTVTLSNSTTYTSGDGTATASQSDLVAGKSVAAFGTTATDGTVSVSRIIIDPPARSNGAAGGFGSPPAASGDSQTN